MAFRPDTKYYINGTDYGTFYEAISAARSMATGTTVVDGNGKVIFTKDNDADTYHLYQYNNYYGVSEDLTYTSSQVIPNVTNNNFGKMLTWLNNFACSKAVNGKGELSNSRIRTFHKHADVSLKSIYAAQETASGGYYAVRTLSSQYDGKQNKAAKIVVNLSGISTNLTAATNAYFFTGMVSGGHLFECGLQLRRETNGAYKWYAICNSTNDGFENLLSTPIANINAGGDAEIELIKGNGSLTAYVKYNGTVKYTKTYTDSYFSDSYPNEFYRMISFCPVDSNAGDNPTPNLNNSEYFAGTAFKNCYIKRGSATSYANWAYNASFNQYAVAFNEEFIDVTPSTETVDISYKGRDTSNNLIVT